MDGRSVNEGAEDQSSADKFRREMEHALLIDAAKRLLNLNGYIILDKYQLMTARVDFVLDPNLIAPSLKEAALKSAVSNHLQSISNDMLAAGLVRLMTPADTGSENHSLIVTVVKPKEIQ
jgi:hypothetical protein